MTNEHRDAMRATGHPAKPQPFRDEAEVRASAVPTVPQMLSDLGKINRERGLIYGEDYKHAGELLMALFPRGIMLRTPEEMNRFNLLVFMACKLNRYSQMLLMGGHEDSLDDLAVYAMLAKECDLLEKVKSSG